MAPKQRRGMAKAKAKANNAKPGEEEPEGVEVVRCISEGANGC